MIKRDAILGCAVVTCMAILLGTAAFHGFEANASPRGDVALLLAQSCVGEAGLSAHKTGECAAIWAIYAKRARRAGVSLYRQTKLYSAAVKHWENKPNLWVMYLSRSGRQPQNWPRKLRWENHRQKWLDTVAYADRWLAGHIADPTPTAMHYGGWIDRNRLDPKMWKRIKTPGWGNWFYERRR